MRESHPSDFTEQNLSKEIVLTNKETISESLSSKMPQYPFFDFCIRKIYPFELFHPQISASCARHFRTSERQVQGAAISIYIAAPCTCKIHIENQPLTNLKKSPVQSSFLHPYFHPIRSPFKNHLYKKNPVFISCFQSKFVHLYQVIKAERRNAKNPAPLLIRYLSPNFLLFTS